MRVHSARREPLPDQWWDERPKTQLFQLGRLKGDVVATRCATVLRICPRQGHLAIMFYLPVSGMLVVACDDVSQTVALFLIAAHMQGLGARLR